MIKNNIIKSEHIKLLLLLLLSIGIVYFTPSAVKNILFLFYPLLFYNSKENYFWIAFLLILIEQPSGLFYGGERDYLYRLPLYPLSPNISVSFEQIMIITALIKSIKLKQKFNPIIIKNYLYYFLLLFFLLIFISFFIGFEFNNFKLVFRTLINITLFYSMFFLIDKEDEWEKFFKILFPFSFYAILLQIYSLINGHQLINLFDKTKISAQGVLGDVTIVGIERPIELYHVLLLTFYGSLYFLLKENNVFRKNYLIFVNIFSTIAVLISATRSLFLAFTFSYLLILIFVPKFINKIILRYGVLISIFIIILLSTDIISNQLSNAFKRIDTITLLAKGDITAGGTLIRYDVRAPAVWAAFKESTILFGEGFSRNYFNKADGHVGYHNFLLNAGIIGGFLMLAFITSYLGNFFRIFLQLSPKNPYKYSLLIFPIAFIGILIINAGMQFLGYDIILNRVLVLTFIFYFGNTVYKKAISVPENLPYTNDGKFK